MEKINYSDNRFYPNYIIPEINDELTMQWGRAIVNNLINGYGLFGTTTVYMGAITTIPIPFSKIYRFPPSIFIMYKPLNEPVSWLTNPVGPTYTKRIWWSFTGDGLLLKNNPDPNYDNQSYDVFYRIHGV